MRLFGSGIQCLACFPHVLSRLRCKWDVCAKDIRAHARTHTHTHTHIWKGRGRRRQRQQRRNSERVEKAARIAQLPFVKQYNFWALKVTFRCCSAGYVDTIWSARICADLREIGSPIRYNRCAQEMIPFIWSLNGEFPDSLQSNNMGSNFSASSCFPTRNSRLSTAARQSGKHFFFNIIAWVIAQVSIRVREPLASGKRFIWLTQENKLCGFNRWTPQKRGLCKAFVLGKRNVYPKAIKARGALHRNQIWLSCTRSVALPGKCNCAWNDAELTISKPRKCAQIKDVGQTLAILLDSLFGMDLPTLSRF